MMDCGVSIINSSFTDPNGSSLRTSAVTSSATVTFGSVTAKLAGTSPASETRVLKKSSSVRMLRARNP